MLEASHLIERVARTLAADGSVSRRELLLGSRRESTAAGETAQTTGTGGVPTTPQEIAALRAILQAATPEPAELRALVDALTVPGADGRLSAGARSRIASVRARIEHAKAHASSVRRRSDLRLALISYLADTDALLASLEELGAGPDAPRVAALRARITSLNTRMTATEKRIMPKLQPVKARRTS
jgi:hypothetical protein